MTAEHLRIAIADDELDMREFLAKVLAHLGHDVLVTAVDGRELIEKCRQTPVDLVITDIRMPRMDGLDAIRELCREAPRPAILISAYHDDELIQRVLQEQVLAYLVKPVTRDQLQPAIVLAMRRYREFEELRHEAEDMRQALEDRKLIERAKGVLMTRGCLSEPDAFRRMQQLAGEKRCRMVEIARSIITTEEAFTS
ncbi:MAG: response regulator [Planctomycetales bacterium]